MRTPKRRRGVQRQESPPSRCARGGRCDRGWRFLVSLHLPRRGRGTGAGSTAVHTRHKIRNHALLFVPVGRVRRVHGGRSINGLAGRVKHLALLVSHFHPNRHSPQPLVYPHPPAGSVITVALSTGVARRPPPSLMLAGCCGIRSAVCLYDRSVRELVTVQRSRQSDNLTHSPETRCQILAGARGRTPSTQATSALRPPLEPAAVRGRRGDRADAPCRERRWRGS